MSSFEVWATERERARAKGAELRAARQAAGLRLEDVVSLLNHPSRRFPVVTNVAALSRIETGQLLPDTELGLALSLWMQEIGLQTSYSAPTGTSAMSTPVMFPTPARGTHPDTSRKAMASVNRGNASAIHQWIILRLANTELGMTHEELWQQFAGEEWMSHRPKSSQSGLRTRVSELVRGGVVQDSGRTRIMTTGRQAIVWELVPDRAVSDGAT